MTEWIGIAIAIALTALCAFLCGGMISESQASGDFLRRCMIAGSIQDTDPGMPSVSAMHRRDYCESAAILLGLADVVDGRVVPR